MTIFDTVCEILSEQNVVSPLWMQTYEVQAEKRGNFVVIGCLEGSRVISWSLNVNRGSLFFPSPELS
jgi:hypothetical protein